MIPALASRGATSLPRGEPIPTVIICNVACKTVVMGFISIFPETAALISTTPLPYRWIRNQPMPPMTPQTSKGIRRSIGDTRATAAPKLK